MVTEGFNLTVSVIVAGSEGLVGEAEFFLLASGYGEVVVSVAVLGLKVVEVGSEVSVTAQLNLGSSGEIGFLSEFGIELAGQLALLLLEAGLLISSTAQVGLRVIESL